MGGKDNGKNLTQYVNEKHFRTEPGKPVNKGRRYRYGDDHIAVGRKNLHHPVNMGGITGDEKPKLK